MKNIIMLSNYKNVIRLSLWGILLISFVFTGCRDRNTKNQPAEKEVSTMKEQAENTDFTLAFLNALFYEEDFEPSLKSQLQLSERQIGDLQVAATTAVEKLSEDD